MKLIGLMPVRNENWILGCSLRAALKWCDAMVVLAHCCTDNSFAIIDEISNEHPNRVVAMIRPSEDEWPEMEHRQKLLDVGRALGGTHFALVDADEVLTAQLLHPRMGGGQAHARQQDREMVFTDAAGRVHRPRVGAQHATHAFKHSLVGLVAQGFARHRRWIKRNDHQRKLAVFAG